MTTLADRQQDAANPRGLQCGAVPTAALLSFRLGGNDGVSIEAAKWAGALRDLGWDILTVAGAGPVDIRLEGLAIDAPSPPTHQELVDALAPADLVVIENLCSLPLNPPASALAAAVCAGRPAVLHHHDLPWQRPNLAHMPPPPDDPSWAHVTINQLSRRELAGHGIAATTIYNSFDPNPQLADRSRARGALGLEPDVRLLLQPTRALARKNIAGGLDLATAVGGTYWLLGPAEDGYGPELDRLVAGARVPVLLGAGVARLTIAEAYATGHAQWSVSPTFQSWMCFRRGLALIPCERGWPMEFGRGHCLPASPTAIRCERVLKKSTPCETAGVARVGSPSGLTLSSSNVPAALITETSPLSAVR